MKGLKTVTPVSWKSLMLRVASVALRPRQIDAICAPNPSMGAPAASRWLTMGPVVVRRVGAEGEHLLGEAGEDA